MKTHSFRHGCSVPRLTLLAESGARGGGGRRHEGPASSKREFYMARMGGLEKGLSNRFARVPGQLL